MSKKVNLSTLIIAVVIAVAITFTFTFGVVQIANTIVDAFSAVQISSTVGERVDQIQSTLPEDKRNSELFETLAFIDYYYQKNYVGEIDNDSLTFYLMNAYIEYVGDKYGMYYTPEMVDELFSSFQGVKVGIGVYIKNSLADNGIKVLAVMDNSPASKAGLKNGDIIVEIDGNLVSTLGYELASEMIAGEPETKVLLGVIGTDGVKRPVEVTRAEFDAQSVFYRKYQLDSTVGIVRILDFNNNTPAQFKNAVNTLIDSGVTSLIFDVRSNSGGTLDSCLEMLDYLLPSGVIAKITDGDGNIVKQYYSDAGEINVPMAVLTDGHTASAAELFTCALKDYGKATIIGTKTYGKGCMQNVFELPCGGALRYTTNLFNGPTSPNFDGIGISPDITVELDSTLSQKNYFEISDSEDNQIRGAYNALKNNK
jgi:carboxyl-terminal processing protease